MELRVHDTLARTASLATHVVIEADLETLASACLAAAVRFACPNRHHHGIDFKNPFTMSKREPSAPVYRRIATTELVSSSLGYSLWRRTPSVAAKLRLMARYAALAVLAATQLRSGGAYRDRTDDLMLAKQPLSQLS